MMSICGAASFTTVLNNLGNNITLYEAKIATNTTLNGTTMKGIIDAAKKYDLMGVGVKLETVQLKENYIVNMNILGITHWSVVKEINEEFIILADSNLGNYKYDIMEFNQYYTNQTIVVLNKQQYNNHISIVSNTNYISNIDQKYISGNGYAFYVSKSMSYINANPKGYAFKYTIIVPKWGGKVVKLSTKN